MAEMSKRERLEATIRGEKTDRTPVALWRHFPGDDQDPGELAASTVAFQREYDFDFIKVTPASSFCVRDWGVADRWLGNQEAVGAEVPFIQTIFSGLSQAKNLVGKGKLPAHLRQEPEAVRAGLDTITETTVQFIRQARRRGIAGIFLAVQHASFESLAEAEYEEFGVPFDLRLLQAADGLWLNVLHLHGSEVMFDLLADYPVRVVNWHDRETPPSLREGQARVAGAVLGGLRQWETMLRGCPGDVQREAQDAIQQTGGRRFILGTGCVTPITAPWANLRAAREAVA
jgi:uroporphyrinogen decarboxylase